MTPNLPSRWQEILRREAAEKVSSVLAQAREARRPHRLPRWVVPTGAVVAGSVFALALTDARDTTGRSAVPFDRSTVLSTRTAGLGASASDLAPRPSPSPLPTAPAKAGAAPRPEAASPSTATAAPGRRVAQQELPDPMARRPENCPGCDTRRRRLLADPPVPEPVAEAPAPEPTPAPTPPPPVVNVGTRMKAVVTDPIVTGVALAPVTARLAEDVAIGGAVVLPAGATLAGEAFSTQEGDRVQVVFNAVVLGGRTLQFEGWALQEGEMGLRGKVLKKASKGKHGAATLLGAAATGLSYGTSGVVPGAAGAALSSFGSSVGADVEGVSRDWRRSDKVVRIEAGVPITVYLRRDLTLQ